MAVRRVLLRIFSATASSAVLMLPAAAQERTASRPRQLPPVTITAPDVTPAGRVARPKPSQNRGARSRTAVRSNQPVTAGASGVTPGTSSDGAAALQPTAASAVRISGAEVNAVPFSRVGEALEAVPGLIVTQHSGRGQSQPIFPAWLQP